MLLNSKIDNSKTPQLDSVKGSHTSGNGTSLKQNFEHYKACAIKLNLLAHRCPSDEHEMAEFDKSQRDCIKGQMDVLKKCAQSQIKTAADAKYMMALWHDEVIKSQVESQITDTDRMVAQLLTYFQNSLKEA